ncbi:prefoldin subunit 5 [Aerococcus sp. 150760007-1]|uniref:Uncharacterized protein n=1 Tax=Aerococcus urinaeequi TaxID=51665 RepID=A0ABR5ZY90_9LACT|nr:hypothetical protein [Aerococcus urinaeequi]MBA5746567.1 hypothetical protein [Aerococcus urinaeequi]MBA5829382.1 hypothetical protein [Aerococcus urinaeequi]MBA5860255.1 hypothetical protein [Aerococcus urinaeequi]
MTEILVLEKPEEKLRRERERLLGELSVYGERLAFLQDTVDEIKEMIECYDKAIENLGTDVHTISDLLATYQNGGENGERR